MVTEHQLKIHKIVPASNQSVCIYFDAPSGFSYKAGQYITLILNINQKEVRRPYSLSSAPALNEMPFITVKEIENGEASRYLHQQIQEGQLLKSLEPNGRFVLPETTPKHVVFFAAGSGISPVFGLIKEALATTSANIELLYSNRSKEEAIFYDELTALQQQYTERFNITWFFSNSKFLLKARLSRIVLEEFVQQRFQNINEVLFYTCGPFVYMEMIFITLLTLGVKPEQLCKETFTTLDEEDDGSLLNDETRNYVDSEVTFITSTQTYLFKVKAHETILQAAIKQQIPMNYSCMRGMCSSCICSLQQGEINMYNNQVLTDNETANGRILVCTAKALTPQLTIKVD